MSAEGLTKRLIIRWTTLKGIAAIILFLIIAILIEYLIVLYAINLGVKDETQLQWSLQFPGTSFTLALVISPLFHLVPLAVIISLVSSWTYLTKREAVKPIEKQKFKSKTAKREQTQKSKAKMFFGKIKSGFLKVKGIAYVWQKIHFARATIKSALTVMLVFLTFIAIASLLTHPQLIYRAVSGAYQNNPSLIEFVNGTAQFFAPVCGFFSAINGALMAVAPGFREIALAFGSLIKPLATLDNAGKYLVFQNVAAWVSALSVLFYGALKRKGYRYKKTGKS